MNFTRCFLFLTVCALVLSGALCCEAAVKALAPYEISEFATRDDNAEEGYRLNPKGKYYYYGDYGGEGCSEFCAVTFYEEEFTATSTLPQIKNTRYDPENLRNSSNDDFEGCNREDVWCEGVKGYGIGERVNLSIKMGAHYKDKEDIICFSSLMIVNGHAKNETTWQNNSRVKTLRLYVGGEPWRDLKLKDTIKPQIFKFEGDERIYPAKSGRRISDVDAHGYSTYQTDFSFEIIEVYKGAKYDDTCITGIQFDIYTQAH